jgi:phosphate:Na+ symporter
MTFLTRIAREELRPEESSRSYELIMVTADIEHIGDIVSKSITAFAEKIDRSSIPLSQEGRLEIHGFFEATIRLLREALAAFTAGDSGLARTVYERKQEMKTQFSSLVDRHMARLYNQNTASLKTDPIHIDLLEEIQRINYFSFRIAGHVLRKG